MNLSSLSHQLVMLAGRAGGGIGEGVAGGCRVAVEEPDQLRHGGLVGPHRGEDGDEVLLHRGVAFVRRFARLGLAAIVGTGPVRPGLRLGRLGPRLVGRGGRGLVGFARDEGGRLIVRSGFGPALRRLVGRAG